MGVALYRVVMTVDLVVMQIAHISMSTTQTLVYDAMVNTTVFVLRPHQATLSLQYIMTNAVNIATKIRVILTETA
jgi:hypothetical protein